MVEVAEVAGVPDLSEPGRPIALLGSDNSDEERLVLTRRGRLLADAVVRTLLP